MYKKIITDIPPINPYWRLQFIGGWNGCIHPPPIYIVKLKSTLQMMGIIISKGFSVRYLNLYSIVMHFFRYLDSVLNYFFNQFFFQNTEHFQIGAVDILVLFWRFFEWCYFDHFHEYNMSKGHNIGEKPCSSTVHDLHMTNAELYSKEQSLVMWCIQFRQRSV